jgi:hypothetical protein
LAVVVVLTVFVLLFATLGLLTCSRLRA